MGPDKRLEIISAYRTVLENRQFSVGRESDLPLPKELIRQTLSEELLEPTNPEMLNIIEEGFLELASFLLDDKFEIIKEFECSVTEVQRTGDNKDWEVR